MNRQERRTSESQGRTSLALLRKQLDVANAERQQLRELLFALAKSHGRMRFAKEVMDGLAEADGIDVRIDDGQVVLEYTNRGGGQ